MMLRLLKFIISIVVLMQLSSCTPSAPYEIKSPCVSAETNDELDMGITPCIRRPVNLMIDIA